MRLSFFVVISFITGGWIMGTSAIYEYAATIIAPVYCELKYCATKIDVGPSAAPIIDIAAASLSWKPTTRASSNVMNIPSCAAAPKSRSLGFESNGPKSIIAPMPINRSNGNSSLAIPAL